MKKKLPNTFEAACKIEKVDPKKWNIKNYSHFPENEREAALAHDKLVIIIRAANRIANGGKEWIADYDDPNQPKYEPYFRGGSSGFRCCGCGGWSSSSSVGSRLAFINRDTNAHVVSKFIKLYKAYYTKKKQ